MENEKSLSPRKTDVFYCPVGNEIEVFETCRKLSLPMLLKGPTGCGKTRFVEAVAASHEQELIKVSCNEDTSVSDLLGRYLLKGGDTVWMDGPVTQAVRKGCMLYLDEVAEAREDVLVVLHALTDHRREIYLDRTGEVLRAPPSFMLIASYNPQYQSKFREMKPSTRQRFVTVSFSYPDFEKEVAIVAKESGLSAKAAEPWVKLAGNIRNLKDLCLQETVSTRLLIYCAKLVRNGLPERLAGEVALVQPLSDDPVVVTALKELIYLKF